MSESHVWTGSFETTMYTRWLWIWPVVAGTMEVILPANWDGGRGQDCDVILTYTGRYRRGQVTAVPFQRAAVACGTSQPRLRFEVLSAGDGKISGEYHGFNPIDTGTFRLLRGAACLGRQLRRADTGEIIRI